MPIFEALATACAPAVALDLLAAIAMVESGIHPLAIRDGTTIALAASSGEGVAKAVGAADQGRDAGIGLMGLTAGRLQKAGVSIADGFDPCISMAAAQTLIKGAHAEADKRGIDLLLWDRVAIRGWWRPDNRFVSGAAYESAVTAERSKVDTLAKISLKGSLSVSRSTTISVTRSTGTLSSTKDNVSEASQRAPREPSHNIPAPSKPAVEPPKWDVFARAKLSGVVIFSK
jgi:type IV secretion system protein VirB1